MHIQPIEKTQSAVQALIGRLDLLETGLSVKTHEGWWRYTRATPLLPGQPNEPERFLRQLQLSVTKEAGQSVTCGRNQQLTLAAPGSALPAARPLLGRIRGGGTLFTESMGDGRTLIPPAGIMKKASTRNTEDISKQNKKCNM
ncbi:hypothetical protein NDU88_004449 [Pleurodeles waltl]|uniref:Uncharacterized protein n=1 Tax=Pleurodeles waltl TaxID=8319 RepID=A0AAV7TU63_PLEWA|nr:hypothetical protein NDU88_004449 [Pleurodeles waltl]